MELKEDTSMGCFVVPAVEAVVTTAVEKIVEAKEKKEQSSENAIVLGEKKAMPFSRKIKWLNKMLWGGSALLAFEHLWHGELVPWFPFLTAAGNSEDAMVMLQEMSTRGVTMAVLVTVVWAGMVVVSNHMEKSQEKNTVPVKQGEKL